MSELTIKQFLNLEKIVWDALVTGDIAVDSCMLTDDFLGVYGDEFALKNDHVNQLLNGPTVEQYQLSEAQIKVLNQDLVILSYLARFSRKNRIKALEEEAMYVSSIWQHDGQDWKNCFSQDTPAIKTQSEDIQ